MAKVVDISPHATQELVERLRAGDVRAVEELYDRYFRKLYLSAFAVLKDRFASEDIVQEVFVSLWQRREGLVLNRSFEAYLTRAVRNQVLNHIRLDKAQHVSLFERLEERIWGPADPENQLYVKELQLRVQGIVEQMPEKMRAVYQLSRVEGLSHKEIAERLNLSPKTVEAQIRNALIRLRESLGNILPLIILILGVTKK